MLHVDFQLRYFFPLKRWVSPPLPRLVESGQEKHKGIAWIALDSLDSFRSKEICHVHLHIYLAVYTYIYIYNIT